MSPRSAAVALAAVACGSAGLAHAEDRDPWLGRDKALHFGATATLALGGYGGAALATESRPVRLVTGAAVGFGAGLAKELYDLSGRGDPSVRDLAWDAVGTATGVLVAYAIDRLFFDRRGAGHGQREAWRRCRTFASR